MGEGLDDRWRRRIESTDWDDLVPRLLAYTANRLSERGVPENLLPKMADAVVNQAIRHLLNRPHEYHGGTLFTFIVDIIDDIHDRAGDDGLVVRPLSTDRTNHDLAEL